MQPVFTKLKALYKKETRQATWLELFFDLIFIAVIGVVTHDLAHTHNQHISIAQNLMFPLVFIPVWWIWASHTLYANKFDNDDRTQRLTAFGSTPFFINASTASKSSSLAA